MVPVRPAVAKYLRRFLQLQPDEAFQLTKKCTLGRLLYHALRNPQDDRSYTITADTHPGKFFVTVSQHMSWLNGCRHLTDQTVHDFNRQVEEEIEKEFLGRLKTLAEYGIEFENKKEALRFQQLYDFTEDDMTLDALIKMYYRYRKAQKEAAERQELIPNCPVAQAA